MPNTYISTYGSNNQPLRASKLQDIYNQAKHLYLPAQALSPLRSVIDPTNPFKLLIDTGSTSYVDIPELTVNMISSGRRLFVRCPLHIGLLANNTYEIVTAIDGVVQTNSNRSLVLTSGFSQGAYLHTYHFISAVIASGQHTVKLQVKRNSGSGNIGIYALQHYRLNVREY